MHTFLTYDDVMPVYETDTVSSYDSQSVMKYLEHIIFTIDSLHQGWGTRGLKATCGLLGP
jgi:hypothetical protein